MIRVTVKHSWGICQDGRWEPHLDGTVWDVQWKRWHVRGDLNAQKMLVILCMGVRGSS